MQEATGRTTHTGRPTAASEALRLALVYIFQAFARCRARKAEHFIEPQPLLRPCSA